MADSLLSAPTIARLVITPHYVVSREGFYRTDELDFVSDSKEGRHSCRLFWPEVKEGGLGLEENGEIKFYLDGELMADWSGSLGNNDKHGSYFKYGIYVPGESGVEVWEAGFKQRRIDKK